MRTEGVTTCAATRRSQQVWWPLSGTNRVQSNGNLGPWSHDDNRPAKFNDTHHVESNVARKLLRDATAGTWFEDCASLASLGTRSLTMCSMTCWARTRPRAQLQSTSAVADNVDGCLSSKSLQSVHAVNCVTKHIWVLAWMVLSGESLGACDAGAKWLEHLVRPWSCEFVRVLGEFHLSPHAKLSSSSRLTSARL